MENLLYLYALPYDPKHPLVCFDERPCFLIGDVVEGLAPQPGKVAKEHYAYSKQGSCVVLAAVEPLSGQRLVRVYAQRTQKEYTAFMQELAALYPDAVMIRLVQDNLNTHTTNSFYRHLSAGEAFSLAQRFDGAARAVALHTQVSLLAQYDRIRLFSLSSSMPESAHSHASPTGNASVSLGR